MAIKLNSAKFDHISPANKAALLAKFGGKANSLQLDPKFLMRGRMKRGDYVKPKRVAPRPDIVRDILQKQSNKHMNNELNNDNKRRFETMKLKEKGQFLSLQKPTYQ